MYIVFMGEIRKVVKTFIKRDDLTGEDTTYYKVESNKEDVVDWHHPRYVNIPTRLVENVIEEVEE